MYREIIIPTETKQTIEFPEEFVGKQVEIIAFPIEEKERNQSKTEQAFNFWRKHSIDMSHFKFDRDKANER
ncbi:MAG TPA: hypothetical protein VN722_05310 [Hanamia sp.]|nr:hypothetical protein [Hanamia sp.]